MSKRGHEFLTAGTRWDVRSHADEYGWVLEYASDDTTFKGPPFFVDTFRDPGSLDQVCVIYTPRSRQIETVLLQMETGGRKRGVVWNETTCGKTQLVKHMLGGDAQKRQELAAHWSYGRDNWWAWHQENKGSRG